MGQFTTEDGCTLTFQDTETSASGRTLVLVHGWSQSRAMFDRVMPLLAAEHRVISYDQRGHGDSPWTGKGARIARLASDLGELLAHLGVQSADFIGHSLGASVLWSFIDTHGTDRIDSLVVVDQPSACVVLPWMDEAEGGEAGAILDFPGAEGFCKAILGPDSAQVRQDFLTSMLSDDISAEDYAFVLEENLKLDADFGTRLLLDHVMQDWRDVLPTIDVPTLVTGGAVSHVAAASQEWTAAHIPDAEVHIFTAAEGGSHFPFFEAPEAYAAVILTFLAA